MTPARCSLKIVDMKQTTKVNPVGGEGSVVFCSHNVIRTINIGVGKDAIQGEPLPVLLQSGFCGIGVVVDC